MLDGVFTRMGAADNLALGASTFLEEMSECSAILAAATPRSLVVLDELGRGTSTHDGVAVAHATLDHLVAGARCLTLFVTHYPSVARELRAKHPKHCAAAFTSYMEATSRGGGVGVGGGGGGIVGGNSGGGSVSVAVEGGGGAAGEEPEEEAPAGEHIEFMYKLTPGVAHRSFGLNVARMAGLPPGLVRRAGVKARELELATARRSALRTMGSEADVETSAAAAEKPTRDVLRAIDASGAAAAADGASEGARILAECQSTLE